MSKDLTFSGATRDEALALASNELGIAADALDVRAVVQRVGADASPEVEITVRVQSDDTAPDTQDLMAGFGKRSAPSSAAPAPSRSVPAPPPAAVEATPVSESSPPPRRPRARRDGNTVAPETLVPKAETFLSGLLERMGVNAELTSRADEDNVYVEITAADGLGGLLIGRKGQTLDAIQYLVNRVVLPGSAARGRIYLDTENYRAKHQRKVEQMAARLRDEALDKGQSITVEELNPRDRWIIHQALLDDARVTTRSVGDPDHRKLLIIPR